MVYQCTLALEKTEEIGYFDSDKDISNLRNYVLVKTMKSFLDKRTSLKTRTESLEWLLSDEIQPFSFKVCCANEGVNPFALREKILEQLNNA